MNLNVADLWTAGGVLLGFQVSSFLWRISQEVEVADRKSVTWLPPTDVVNLIGMVVVAFGVFIFPLLGLQNLDLSLRLFGLGVLLFIGHCFALAGHYEMYNPRTLRSYKYFPIQEKVAICVVIVTAAVYLIRVFGA